MEPQALTREEARALLAACPQTTTGIRDRAVLVTLYRGAARISATLGIRPADIDWERGLVTMHHDKGGKGRTVVLDAGAMSVLRTWAERRKSLGINGHHPFFCAVSKSARGNRMLAGYYRNKIKSLQRIAGIEKRCHLHMLRHTAASELMEEGFDLLTIGAQLGHEDPSTTRHYLHRVRPDLANKMLAQRDWDFDGS